LICFIRLEPPAHEPPGRGGEQNDTRCGLAARPSQGVHRELLRENRGTRGSATASPAPAFSFHVKHFRQCSIDWGMPSGMIESFIFLWLDRRIK
jgi:hypothetical protein